MYTNILQTGCFWLSKRQWNLTFTILGSDCVDKYASFESVQGKQEKGGGGDHETHVYGFLPCCVLTLGMQYCIASQ